MRPIPLALATLFLLSACTDDEQAQPRPTVSAEDLAGQSRHFKVTSDTWLVNGNPGDDTFGFVATVDEAMITEAIFNDGRVRVHLQRANNNWAELPLLASQGAPGGLNWRFTYRIGLVQILIDRNGENFSAPEETMVFKVVVHPN